MTPDSGSTCTQLPDSALPQYTSAQQRPPEGFRAPLVHIAPADFFLHARERMLLQALSTPLPCLSAIGFFHLRMQVYSSSLLSISSQVHEILMGTFLSCPVSHKYGLRWAPQVVP